ncbi:DDB1- and CUL4-associated factor 8 [Eurytemora carolleeae]|uniref:DDB1- and CUL4-associated factor 8 n=1 Tax=Eurytemora carolleeae TaxID=1294199 RepID=UPI000C77025D|nr:DDB1- and CUL4-associated factor 8 [Eurytemora carolleeae]|eukprot:XP_023338808.1 DDB1- and CUL4-associated factor 8-like [Eurytemora affinis]
MTREQEVERPVGREREISTGNRIASGSDDLKIKIWDWERRKQVVSFPTGHRENVFQSKFVSGDLLIASCSRDGQVMLAQLCPAGSLRSTSRLAQHRGPAHKMCLIQEQGCIFLYIKFPILLSAGEDGQVISIDIREENSDKIVLLKNDKGRKIPLYSIHNNPVNRNQFCTAGRDPYIRIFDRRYIGNAKQGEMAKFCPTELRTTKVNVNEGAVGVILIGMYVDENTNYKSRFRGHRNSATVKGVNYYGGRSEYVISGSDCGNVFFWDKETEGIVNIFHGDDNGVVNVLESHPTLPVLATSGLDEEVKVWLPTLSMNDSEEKKILKKKKDYMLRTISRNLVE